MGSRDPAPAAGRFYLGVDVGTGSVRAAVFDGAGVRLGLGIEPIEVWNPRPDFYEQSSDDIWRACGVAIRGALAQGGVAPKRVVGIGFDATCSLVVVDAEDRPVSVASEGDDRRNVVLWMDHRAIDQATRINAGRHSVLEYVGGAMSPEMQVPKLLWLKERLPRTWARAARFLDLPDFLAYRATGVDVRSLCTAVCKWSFLGHLDPDRGGRWDDSFFRAVGLSEIADEGFRRIGSRVRPMGERAGVLGDDAACELGLAPGTAVAVSIIDAHAGGLGMLGAPAVDESGGGQVTSSLARGVSAETLVGRLALIGGTSSCHMAVSKEPRFVPGVWGPYFSAMVPGMWLAEGGQSATGALIDHTIASHARGPDLAEEARRTATTPHALLNARLDALAAAAGGGAHAGFPGELTRDLHVLPDHHGNRSPRADPTLRGMVSGLSLDRGIDSLALLYLATIQGLAHGTRHIIETMRAAGHRIDTIFACGGDTKNPVFVREHADVTGCPVLLSREPEAVLLGAAVLGAVASGDHPSVLSAMGSMSSTADRVVPAGGGVAAYHAAKHRVFLRMHDDQVAYRRIMSRGGT